MTPKKRMPVIILGSVLVMLLGSVVPTAANSLEQEPVSEPTAVEATVAPENDAVELIDPEVASDLSETPESDMAPQEADVPPADLPAPAADSGELSAQDEGAGELNATSAPAAAKTYTVRGTITLPAGVKFTGTSISLNNRPSFTRWDAPGAFTQSGVLNPATGAWSATGIPAGEYRLWLPYGGHQLLPGKIVVTNANVSGLTTKLAVTGQPWLGFMTPTGASDVIEKITFRNQSTGRETRVSDPLSGLGLATDPFVDLSAAGLCQAGGFGMAYWCPILAPGNYTLRFELSNGKTVYYNGDNGGQQARPPVSGTRDATRATTIQVAAFQSYSLQHVDVRTHFAPSFTDVPNANKFAGDIRWLAESGITTGVKQSDGTYKFLPKQKVSREAMIAFLYRANGVKSYQPKGASPFVDVKKGDQFYTQIMWAYENKVTTGIALGGGKRKFDPKATITREAMAAFMYRQYSQSIPVGSVSPKFTDVPANYKFAKEIKWMASNKITTGVKQPNGTVKFDPKGATSREATAAFLHRAELKKK